MYVFYENFPSYFSVVGYTIFRGSNSQKNAFRQNPYNPALARKFTGPQICLSLSCLEISAICCLHLEYRNQAYIGKIIED